MAPQGQTPMRKDTCKCIYVSVLSNNGQTSMAVDETGKDLQPLNTEQQAAVGHSYVAVNSFKKKYFEMLLVS